MSYSSSRACSRSAMYCVGARGARGRAPAAGGPDGGSAIASAQDPVGVPPGEVAVGVDHLGLDPEAELHAESAHVVDERVQARPATRSRRRTSRRARRCRRAGPRNQPSSSTKRSTPTDGRARRRARRGVSRAWSKYTASQVLSVTGRGRRGCCGRRAPLVVEAVRELVEPVAPRADRPRGSCSDSPWARTISPGPSSSPPARNASPVGVRSASEPVVAAPGHVDARARGRARTRSPGGRRRARGVASAPGRPRRLSRRWSPNVKACRCGERSRRCRPVVSRSSVASHGTGKARCSDCDRVAGVAGVAQRDALVEAGRAVPTRSSSCALEPRLAVDERQLRAVVVGLDVDELEPDAEARRRRGAPRGRACRASRPPASATSVARAGLRRGRRRRAGGGRRWRGRASVSSRRVGELGAPVHDRRVRVGVEVDDDARAAAAAGGGPARRGVPGRCCGSSSSSTRRWRACISSSTEVNKRDKDAKSVANLADPTGVHAMMEPIERVERC